MASNRLGRPQFLFSNIGFKQFPIYAKQCNLSGQTGVTGTQTIAIKEKTPAHKCYCPFLSNHNI